MFVISVTGVKKLILIYLYDKNPQVQFQINLSNLIFIKLVNIVVFTNSLKNISFCTIIFQRFYLLNFFNQN